MVRIGLRKLMLLTVIALGIITSIISKHDKKLVNPPEFTVDEHLSEPRVVNFFEGSQWSLDGKNQFAYDQFSSPTSYSSYYSPYHLIANYDFMIKEVHLDEKTGQPYWLVEYKDVQLSGPPARAIIFFPQATAVSLGNLLRWQVKTDNSGHILPNTGTRLLRITP